MMAENLPLVIAQRRNLQLRGRSKFEPALSNLVGMPECYRLLDAEESLKIERLILAMLRGQRTNGRFYSKHTALDRDTARRILSSAETLLDRKPAIVFLSHYPEFLFKASFDWYLEHALQLSDFDHDTIFAVGKDMTFGISLDVYTEGGDSRTYYEIEGWGIELSDMEAGGASPDA